MSKKNEAIKIANETIAKYHRRAAAELLGSEWREFPIQLTVEGLLICVDAQVNRMADCVASEDFCIEFVCDKNVSTFHLWNEWGVITSRPVAFTLQDNISSHAKKFLSDLYAKGQSVRSMHSVMIVVENETIIGLKTFGLDSQITQRIIDMCLAESNEGEALPSFAVLQKVKSIKSSH